MSDDPLGTLLSIAEGPLGGEPSPGVADFAGRHGPELSALLKRMNGFYAFESALHVFPSGTTGAMSIENWNSDALWRSEYGVMADGLVFFAEDIFGVQFALCEEGVSTFDPETGEAVLIAGDLVSWAAKLLGDYDVMTGYSLAHEWQVQHGALASDCRLFPKLPFVVGGGFEVENLSAVNAVDGMRNCGYFATQIADIPDGTTFNYRIVD